LNVLLQPRLLEKSTKWIHQVSQKTKNGKGLL